MYPCIKMSYQKIKKKNIRANFFRNERKHKGIKMCGINSLNQKQY
jgi:hypothetical protein